MYQITIKEKSYPCVLTPGALIRFKRTTGKDPQHLSGDFEDMMQFIYQCIASACRAEQMEFSIDFDTFIDSVGMEQLLEAQTQLFGALTEEEKLQTVPKKKK